MKPTAVAMSLDHIPAGLVVFEEETPEQPNPQVRELKDGLYEATYRFRIEPQLTVRNYLESVLPLIDEKK